jgi:uncharacterized membrane protein YbaN (DUF454 family)
MTPRQAKEILLLYRPGTADAEDPEVVAAVEHARRDPELARWFEQHCAFQNALRAKLRQMEVPAHLKGALMAQQNIIRPPSWWRHPVWLSAAAAVVILLGLAGVWLKPAKPDRFANFRARMVSTALREYRMDVVTNDMRQLRQFIAGKGAPAEYRLTKGLEKLELTGGGCLQWRSNPVAMVCFNRGDDQMLFLFVMKRSALEDAPGQTPESSTVTALQTVSWSQGDYTYLLAGPEDPEFLRKYL